MAHPCELFSPWWWWMRLQRLPTCPFALSNNAKSKSRTESTKNPTNPPCADEDDGALLLICRQRFSHRSSKKLCEILCKSLLPFNYKILSFCFFDLSLVWDWGTVWIARFLTSAFYSFFFFFFFFFCAWTVTSHGFTVHVLFNTVHVLFSTIHALFIY